MGHTGNRRLIASTLLAFTLVAAGGGAAHADPLVDVTDTIDDAEDTVEGLLSPLPDETPGTGTNPVDDTIEDVSETVGGLTGGSEGPEPSGGGSGAPGPSGTKRGARNTGGATSAPGTDGGDPASGGSEAVVGVIPGSSDSYANMTVDGARATIDRAGSLARPLAPALLIGAIALVAIASARNHRGLVRAERRGGHRLTL
ncbi:MAG TPA: hypothetical protein VGB83_01380 [Actinomycetota bacterium]